MSVKAIIAFIIGIGLSSATIAAAKDLRSREQDKREVLKLERDQNQALSHGDIDAINRLWPEEFSYISAKGEQLTKAEIIDQLKSGKRRYFTVSHDRIEVHDYGNTIVLRGVSKSRVLSKGVISSGPRTFVDIFAKQDGTWRSVAHTANPIVKP